MPRRSVVFDKDWVDVRGRPAGGPRMRRISRPRDLRRRKSTTSSREEQLARHKAWNGWQMLGIEWRGGGRRGCGRGCVGEIRVGWTATSSAGSIFFILAARTGPFCSARVPPSSNTAKGANQYHGPTSALVGVLACRYAERLEAAE